MSKQKKEKSGYKKAKSTATIAMLAMGIGAIIGATAGILNAPKKGKELQSDLEKDGERLWKKLKMSKKKIENEVDEIFGEVSPQAMKMYAKAKSEILARVVKGKETLSKADYDKIVDQVSKRLTKSKNLEKSVKKLSKEFKKKWREIERHI